MKITTKQAAYKAPIERQISRNNKIIAQALRKLLVPALLIAASTTQADCNLTVQFTRNNQAALSEVTSIIYRQGAFIAADDRHSYTVKLPCPSEYQIAATSGAQHRHPPLRASRGIRTSGCFGEAGAKDGRCVVSITYIFTCDKCGITEKINVDAAISCKEQETHFYIKGIDHNDDENHLCQDCFDVWWSQSGEADDKEGAA